MNNTSCLSSHRLLSPSGVYSDTFVPKTWNGPQNFNAMNIWTDGTNIYVSGGNHYILNGDTFERLTDNGWPSFGGNDVWTDGSNLYAIDDTNNHYVFNKDSNSWEAKTWNGTTPYMALYIWTDGTNIYYSGPDENGTRIYLVLNGDTWEEKSWNTDNELGNMPSAMDIWTDGTDIYANNGTAFSLVLNKETDTWENKTWTGDVVPTVWNIWNLGTKVYDAFHDKQYVLNGDTWEVKTWYGLPGLQAQSIWTDGHNIYHSYGGEHYVLLPALAKIYTKNNGEWTQVTRDPTAEQVTVTPSKSEQVVTPTTADYISKVTVEAIPDKYFSPSGTKNITSNGDGIDVRAWAYVNVNVEGGSSVPTEIANETEMTAILEGTPTVGAVYKYMGETTETYENGALYIVEEA